MGKTGSINGNAAADSFRVLCDGFGPDVYPDHKRSSGRSWEPQNPDKGTEWVVAQWNVIGSGDTNVQYYRVKEIVIVESFNPGSIVAVDAIENHYLQEVTTLKGGMKKVRLWSGNMEPADKSRVTVLRFSKSMDISVIRVVLDTGKAAGYNNLDTVVILY